MIIHQKIYGIFQIQITLFNLIEAINQVVVWKNFEAALGLGIFHSGISAMISLLFLTWLFWLNMSHSFYKDKMDQFFWLYSYTIVRIRIFLKTLSKTE